MHCVLSENIIIHFWTVEKFCSNMLPSPANNLQSNNPGSIYSQHTITLIVLLSDRRSAAADAAQTPAGRTSAQDNNNASLVLNRKTLRRRWERISFLYFREARSVFALYQNIGLISVLLQLSCPSSDLLWFMWQRSCFQRSHRKVCVCLWRAAGLQPEPEADVSEAALKSQRRASLWNRDGKLRESCYREERGRL